MKVTQTKHSTVIELDSLAKMLKAFELMHYLRDTLNITEFEKLLQTMIPQGYRMFAMRDDSQYVCVAGIAILTNLYYRKHLWVYDLVTDPARRSFGFGEQMMDFLEDFASDHNCTCVALSSGITRERAHNFYMTRLGFEKVSYVLKKMVK